MSVGAATEARHQVVDELAQQREHHDHADAVRDPECRTETQTDRRRRGAHTWRLEGHAHRIDALPVVAVPRAQLGQVQVHGAFASLVEVGEALDGQLIVRTERIDHFGGGHLPRCEVLVRIVKGRWCKRTRARGERDRQPEEFCVAAACLGAGLARLRQVPASRIDHLALQAECRVERDERWRVGGGRARRRRGRRGWRQRREGIASEGYFEVRQPGRR